MDPFKVRLSAPWSDVRPNSPYTENRISLSVYYVLYVFHLKIKYSIDINQTEHNIGH